jgi:hypothetical protein
LSRITNPDLPDAGEGPCCYGAAVYGPGRCTCWREVYDQEQQPLKVRLPAQRRRMCADCAFRPGSPERNGNGRYEHSGPDDLGDLVYSGKPFACHQGMRRVVKLVHEPTGIEHVLEVDDYAPPTHGSRAWKANGSPADLCAGLRAERMALGLPVQPAGGAS